MGDAMYMNVNDASIERIRKMENIFDNAQSAVKEIRKAIEKYSSAESDIKALLNYYGSDEWKQDYQLDEEGKLPAELKRGVLSEDGIWNFLGDLREIADEMTETAEIMKKTAGDKE